MKSNTIGLLVAAAWFSLFSSAHAAPLSVTDVGAPAVNCVFHTTCSVVVDDSVGTFGLPGDSGDARLQSRTYPGVAPAPAAGDMAYVYRVDLTSAQGLSAANCVGKLALDFGPVVKLPYSDNGNADVFVVTSGGLGSVGLSSANQVGNKIAFTFSSPVCPGATSYFFGLASKTANRVPGRAQVSFSLGGGATVSAIFKPRL